MARRRSYKFTQGAREAFLAQLSVSANVRKAAEAAGIPGSTVYHHRLIDPAFAHQWRMALLAGYDRIELALIRRALGLPDEQEDDAGELDVDLAFRLLNRLKPVVARATSEAVAATFRASRDAAAALLLTKLQSQSKRLGLPRSVPSEVALLTDETAAGA
jgi:hypothetical protein